MQISHKINKLSFGDSIPGLVNPLDGYSFQSLVQIFNISPKEQKCGQSLSVFGTDTVKIII